MCGGESTNWDHSLIYMPLAIILGINDICTFCLFLCGRRVLAQYSAEKSGIVFMKLPINVET